MSVAEIEAFLEQRLKALFPKYKKTTLSDSECTIDAIKNVKVSPGRTFHTNTTGDGDQKRQSLLDNAPLRTPRNSKPPIVKSETPDGVYAYNSMPEPKPRVVDTAVKKKQE